MVQRVMAEGPDILVNGRFMTQRMTGVQRVAHEVTIRLAREGGSAGVRVALPSRGAQVLESSLPDGPALYDDHSILPGNIWQQARLPLIKSRLGARLLWSPCNTGPVFCPGHIVTIHDASVFAGPEWFSRKFGMYYRLLLRALGRTARLVVTDSEFSKEELARYGVAPAHKIRVVYCGVDERFYLNGPTGPNELKETGSKEPYDFPYVLSVGSRDPRKNVKGIIGAWDALSKGIKKDLRLVIVGGGTDSFVKEKLAGKSGAMPEGVHFAGYVPDEDLPALYAGAEAFLFPSLYEGFGLPVIEAMASGCPVITTRAASLPEVAGDAAHYVDPHEPGEMALAIERVLQDGQYRDVLIGKGIEQARRFSWDRAAREYMDIFKESIRGVAG